MTTLTSYDPATDAPVGSVAITSAAEITQAIDRAHEAQRAWQKLTLAQRQQSLTAAYAALQPIMESLAVLISREMGKDIHRAFSETQGATFAGRFYAEEAAAALQPKPLNGSTLEYRALGVVAVISPWNYPLAMANNLIVPALMAGNAVVFKPSEETPLVAQLFVETLNQHLMPGLLQIVHGGDAVGRTLVNGDVQAIAFTGSQAAGRDIMRNASGSLKRLIMELGGNDPMIVMHDADLRRAAAFAVASSYENAGQMCTSTERIYVDAAVAEAFEQLVVDYASRYRTGAWDDSDADIGPIVNARQHAHIVDHLTDAETQGAQFLLGQAEQSERYIEPVVITGLEKTMRMECEETFGPVVAIARFNTLDDAIDRANDSDYGLGAVVFGGNGAQHVAERLEAGMVGVNSGVGGNGDAPWVGAKQSGFGYHGSADGHRQFAQIRVISHA